MIRPKLTPRANTIPTAPATARYSLVWFAQIAVMWLAGSAAIGLVLAFWIQ